MRKIKGNLCRNKRGQFSKCRGATTKAGSRKRKAPSMKGRKCVKWGRTKSKKVCRKYTKKR